MNSSCVSFPHRILPVFSLWSAVPLYSSSRPTHQQVGEGCQTYFVERPNCTLNYCPMDGVQIRTIYCSRHSSSPTDVVGSFVPRSRVEYSLYWVIKSCLFSILLSYVASLNGKICSPLGLHHYFFPLFFFLPYPLFVSLPCSFLFLASLWTFFPAAISVTCGLLSYPNSIC